MFTFDSDKFSKDLKTKRIIKLNVGLREIYNETGVSHATLSRLENGDTPGLVHFATLCKWLEKPMEHYFKKSK